MGKTGEAVQRAATVAYGSSRTRLPRSCIPRARCTQPNIVILSVVMYCAFGPVISLVSCSSLGNFMPRRRTTGHLGNEPPGCGIKCRSARKFSRSIRAWTFTSLERSYEKEDLLRDHFHVLADRIKLSNCSGFTELLARLRRRPNLSASKLSQEDGVPRWFR